MRRIAIATMGSLVVLLALGWSLELPDPIAVHFGADGTADGFAPRAAALPLLVVLPGAIAGIVLALTWTRRRPPQGMRWTTGLAVGMVWGVGGIILAILAGQQSLTDAADASLSPAWILVPMLVGALVTLLASRLVDLPEPPTATAPPPTTDPRAEVGQHTTVLWSGRAPDGAVPFAIALGLLLGAVLGGLLVEWWVGALLVVLAGLLAASMRFTVTIGPAEVRVHGALAGWPRLAVPVSTVTRARVVEVRPFEFGGWGLRMLPGQATTAVVTASGPALELRRSDDSRVVLSLVDAEAAAAVLTSLLARRATTSETSTEDGR